jgi:hypothetical protein
LLLSLTAQYRIGLPQLNLLSKSDLFSDIDLQEILTWAEHLDQLEYALSAQDATVYREMNEGILHLIEGFFQQTQIFPISKNEYYGIEDLYTHLQLMFEGGDDLLSD